MNRQQAWEHEYSGTHGVPTTTRNTPSLAITKLLSYFDANSINPGNRVVDLGCGAGRNTRYLAEKGFQVTAIDFAQSALDKLESSLTQLPYAKNITVKQYSLADKLAFEDNSFDLAIDIVTSMTLSPEDMARYESEIRRLVCAGRYYLSYVLCDDDGYLKAMGKADEQMTIAKSGHIDHYFSERYIRDLYEKWELVELEKIIKEDDFDGGVYERRMWWMLLRNKKQY